MSKRVAIFPGSFDPYTNGHHDIVVRASGLFDEIIIAFGTNSSKKRTFEIPLMMEKLNQLYEGYSNVRIESYKGLTVDYAKTQGAKFILRGLRNATDLRYEMPIASLNHDMDSEIETVFLLTQPENTVVSSTIVREIHNYGRDISAYVPYEL